jgi:hypothetical protein
MKKIRCQLVRAQDVRRITEKAIEIVCHNGVRTVLPASTVHVSTTTEGWFIAQWILEKKAEEGIYLQPARVFGWFDPAAGRVELEQRTVRRVPKAIEAVAPDTTSLQRDA